MKKKRSILLWLLFVVLVMGFVACQHRSVPATVRLNLTGTTGLKVAGTMVVDGVRQQFNGVLPTNITVKAHTFHYTILMQEPQGELRAKLAVEGGTSGSSSTADDFSGVKGYYTDTWRGQSFGVTTVRKKE